MSSAAERIERIVYTSLGVAALLYTAIDMEAATRQVAALTPGWSLTTYLACAILPVVVGCLGPFAPVPALRALASAYCVAYAATVVLWVPLLRGTGGALDETPWTFDVVAIAAGAAAVAWRSVPAWGYLGALAVSTVGVHALSLPTRGWGPAAEDALYALTFSVIVVSIIQVSKAAGARLDAAWRAARDEAEREAREGSARKQRVRLNALIHDHVLSLLLAAARSGRLTREELTDAAASTLTALAPREAVGGVAADELAARVRAAGEGEAFSWHVAAAPDAVFPVDVGAALVEAAGEAMRNSVRHAGVASRTVRIDLAVGRARIDVHDDGRGFTPRRVAPDRLGVRVSIVDRMATVGGRATVVSAPGRGTEVGLCWDADAER